MTLNFHAISQKKRVSADALAVFMNQEHEMEEWFEPNLS